MAASHAVSAIRAGPGADGDRQRDPRQFFGRGAFLLNSREVSV